MYSRRPLTTVTTNNDRDALASERRINKKFGIKIRYISIISLYHGALVTLHSRFIDLNRYKINIPFIMKLKYLKSFSRNDFTLRSADDLGY